MPWFFDFMDLFLLLSSLLLLLFGWFTCSCFLLFLFRGLLLLLLLLVQIRFWSFVLSLLGLFLLFLVFRGLGLFFLKLLPPFFKFGGEWVDRHLRRINIFWSINLLYFFIILIEHLFKRLFSLLLLLAAQQILKFLSFTLLVLGLCCLNALTLRMIMGQLLTSFLQTGLLFYLTLGLLIQHLLKALLIVILLFGFSIIIILMEVHAHACPTHAH